MNEPRIRVAVNAPAGLSEIGVERWQHALQIALDLVDQNPDLSPAEMETKFSTLLYERGFDPGLMHKFCESLLAARAQRAAAESHEPGHA